jgi:phosphatidylinositol alpha-1,6-mannosyltransferase
VFALPVRTRLGGLNPEGLGLGFLEAAASGLPVIVGRSGGARETVREGETGFVIEPDDVDGLATVISDLLTDPGRAAAMGLAGRDLVRERFSSEVAAATLRTVLAPQ